VASWATGKRLVSLPFSDHCEPLAEGAAELGELVRFALRHAESAGCKYVELRPRGEASALAQSTGLGAGSSFAFHEIDVGCGLDRLYRNFHPDSIRRKIRRAEREGLGYESGRSEPLLGKFFKLLVRTRRRQGLPPQPIAWFRNLAEAMGEHLTIRVASKGDSPVAALLTLSYKDTVTYKYGCSDERLHNLGGVPFLFWRTIQEMHQAGMARLDLGRSDFDNPGLIAFKDHLGAKKTALTYYRAPAVAAGASGFREKFAKRVFSHLPDAVLTAAGRVLYRHVG
jgi:CelD/BcsL family acetyltransferase involved in cellulose biosynthesis